MAGFNSYVKNRVDKSGGGIATLISEKDAPYSIKIKGGENDKEYLITRHDQCQTPVNIINIYGMNECRTTKNKI